jgi:hypothetical protein
VAGFDYYGDGDFSLALWLRLGGPDPSARCGARGHVFSHQQWPAAEGGSLANLWQGCVAGRRAARGLARATVAARLLPDCCPTVTDCCGPFVARLLPTVAARLLPIVARLLPTVAARLVTDLNGPQSATSANPALEGLASVREPYTLLLCGGLCGGLHERLRYFPQARARARARGPARRTGERDVRAGRRRGKRRDHAGLGLGAAPPHRIRCVWSFPDLPPTKYWRVPFMNGKQIFHSNIPNSKC